MELLLLIIQIIIVIVLGIRLFKKSMFITLFFAVSALYLIPTEIGYAFYPQLIISTVYSGMTTWYKMWLFSTLSLISFYFFVSFFLKTKCNISIKILPNRSIIKNEDKLVFICLWGYSLLVLLIFIIDYNEISYVNIATNGYADEHLLLKIFVFLYRLQISINILLFGIINSTKELSKLKRNRIKFLFVFNMISYVMYVVKTGSRSSAIGLAVGIFIVIIYTYRIDFKLLIKFAITGITLLLLLNALLHARDASTLIERPLYERVLVQDYFSPSLNILAAISKNYIHPLELISRNIFNILPGANYDAIHVTLGETFTSVVGSSTGLGFHIFTEGYIFGGISGFLYNGIVVGWLITFWHRLANTNNKAFNITMQAVLSTVFFDIVRAESLYFLRNIILIYIPCVIVYCTFTKNKIILVRRGSHEK